MSSDLTAAIRRHAEQLDARTRPIEELAPDLVPTASPGSAGHTRRLSRPVAVAFAVTVAAVAFIPLAVGNLLSGEEFAEDPLVAPPLSTTTVAAPVVDPSLVTFEVSHSPFPFIEGSLGVPFLDLDIEVEVEGGERFDEVATTDANGHFFLSGESIAPASALVHPPLGGERITIRAGDFVEAFDTFEFAVILADPPSDTVVLEAQMPLGTPVTLTLTDGDATATVEARVEAARFPIDVSRVFDITEGTNVEATVSSGRVTYVTRGTAQRWAYLHINLVDHELQGNSFTPAADLTIEVDGEVVGIEATVAPDGSVGFGSGAFFESLAPGQVVSVSDGFRPMSVTTHSIGLELDEESRVIGGLTSLPDGSMLDVTVGEAGMAFVVDLYQFGVTVEGGAWSVEVPGSIPLSDLDITVSWLDQSDEAGDTRVIVYSRG